MLAMPTFQDIRLTENTILFTGIGRGPAETFHALGHNVIIAGSVIRARLLARSGTTLPRR
jgi:short-subunit dehydrogenase involved in D-alanine esterification of teichoic acids